MSTLQIQTLGPVAAALIVGLTSCTSPPRLQGTVVDIWGDPVAGAMVKMDGTNARPMTDTNGRFALPLIPGEHTLKAGMEGYIQADEVVTVPEEGAPEDPLVLELFPIPDTNGFHLVGSDGYQPLVPTAIHAVGNAIRSLYGLREIHGPSVDGTPLRFVYHGPLSQQQLASLDISLHALDFVETAELQGITVREVPLNLYTSDREIPLRMERLKSRNDYLLETSGTVPRSAHYALTTNDLLTPSDDAAFRQIAPELRVAFPVEVR